MKMIQLTKGQVALVDDEDFERLNKFKWNAQFSRDTNSYYAIRSSPRDENGKHHTIRVHREIMNAQPGEEVDHINHDTLDQMKANLRICTGSQNLANTRVKSNNTSGYKGVSWFKNGKKKWGAHIRINGRQKHLGVYVTAKEAALAYDRAAIEHYGENACTNKMLGLLP